MHPSKKMFAIKTFYFQEIKATPQKFTLHSKWEGGINSEILNKNLYFLFWIQILSVEKRPLQRCRDSNPSLSIDGPLQ